MKRLGVFLHSAVTSFGIVANALTLLSDNLSRNSCMYVWMISQEPTSTSRHPHFVMRKLKYSLQDRQKPFSEFQQTAAAETCDKFRYKSFLKPCLYSTWFTSIELVFKLVVACSFRAARVIKNARSQVTGSAFFKTENKQAWPECHIIKLLTNLASSSRTGDYWPSVVLYGPRCARSVLPRPRANIPQYGPRARFVGSYYFLK